MNITLARAVVRGWREDKRVGDIPELISYAYEQRHFLPAGVRLQVIVGTRNRLASSALWDGQWERAVMLLVKHGLVDKSTIAVPPKKNASYISPPRLSGNVRNPKSDWKIVK